MRFPLAPVPRDHGRRRAGDERPHSVPPGPARRQHRHQPADRRAARSTCRSRSTGALAYVGDPHFAQGDGEVALTALEASLRATVRLDVVPARTRSRRFGELAGPLAETTEYLVPTGLDEDLDDRRAALRARRDRAAAGALRHGRRARLRLPLRGHRLRHLARSSTWSRACTHASGRPTSRWPVTRRARTACMEAFCAYERALMADDVAALDDAFAPGPGHAARRRRRPAGRARRDRGVPRGPRRRHAADAGPRCKSAPLADDALVVATTALERRRHAGCRPSCGSVRRRAGWRVTAAHVSGRTAALDTRVWRVVGDPLVPARPTVPCWGRASRSRTSSPSPATGSARATRPGSPTPRRERQHAAAVARLLDAGAVGARHRPHRRVRLLDRGHQRPLRHPAQPRGAVPASPAARRAVRADRGRPRPRQHRARHRHRRLDPRPGRLPGPVGPPHHARRGAAPGPAAAGAALRHGRLADPRRRDARRGRDVVPRGVAPPFPAGVCGARRGRRGGRARHPARRSRTRSSGDLEEVEVGSLDEWFETFRVVQAAEAWRTHGAWVTAHPDAVGPGVRERFAIASEVTASDEASARTEVERLAGVIRALVDDAVLVLPTTPGPRPGEDRERRRARPGPRRDPADDRPGRHRRAARTDLPRADVPVRARPGTRRRLPRRPPRLRPLARPARPLPGGPA